VFKTAVCCIVEIKGQLICPRLARIGHHVFSVDISMDTSDSGILRKFLKAKITVICLNFLPVCVILKIYIFAVPPILKNRQNGNTQFSLLQLPPASPVHFLHADL
jgi:hypothetical protein